MAKTANQAKKTSKLRQSATAVAATALVLAPRLAEACACQGAQTRLTTTLKLVGAFLLVPFLIFAVIVLVVRSLPTET